MFTGRLGLSPADGVMGRRAAGDDQQRDDGCSEDQGGGGDRGGRGDDPPRPGGRGRGVDKTLNALRRGSSARAEGTGRDAGGGHGQQGTRQGEPVLAADRRVISGDFHEIADLMGGDGKDPDSRERVTKRGGEGEYEVMPLRQVGAFMGQNGLELAAVQPTQCPGGQDDPAASRHAAMA